MEIKTEGGGGIDAGVQNWDVVLLLIPRSGGTNLYPTQCFLAPSPIRVE